ncbi:hypothetical protein ABZV80_40295 [Streptomyces sp. NPDC005132]|uniref:hypothetical protein n=1 Tax=Streptomyces sp. NPDC005132 TaxID=3154294 RepID=UPI0033A826B3
MAAALMQLAPGATSQRELTIATSLDPRQLVAIRNKVGTSGLAERRRDPANRRRHIVEITSAGTTDLERVDEAARELFGDLTEADGLLNRIVVDTAVHNCGAEWRLPLAHGTRLSER